MKTASHSHLSVDVLEFCTWNIQITTRSSILSTFHLIAFAVGLKMTPNCSGVQSKSASLNNKEIILCSDCPRLLRMSAACWTLWPHERKSVAKAVRTSFSFSPNLALESVCRTAGCPVTRHFIRQNLKLLVDRLCGKRVA